MKFHYHFGRICQALLLLTFIQTGSVLPIFSQDEAEASKQKPLTFYRYPGRFYGSRPFTPDQRLLLRFNEPVDLTEVGRHFSFFEEKNKVRVPVNVKRPTVSEIKAFGSSLVSHVSSGDGQKRFVMIEPASSLAIGPTWMLTTRKGLTNESKTHVLTRDIKKTLGTLSEFKIGSIYTSNPYDGEMSIVVSHNKYGVNSLFDANKLSQYIEISPEPEGMAVESQVQQFRIRGKFEYDQPYKVTVKPGIISKGKIQLNQQFERTVAFEPNRGFVRLPMFSATQSASGHRSFDIQTANLKSVRTRVKQLKGDRLIFALKGYQDGYEGSGEDGSIPFSMVAGKTIYDQTRERTAEMDKSETFELTWSEVNPDSDYGAYYVCAEGPSDARGYTSLGAQALVQVTDIGLAWKQNRTETLIYAFSIKNGSSRKGISVRLLTEEGEEVATANTDDSGIARFSAKDYQDEDLWLDAAEGEDRHLMSFSRNLDKIGLWSFDIPYRYSGVKEGERRTLIFTDRDVYKPGETVYLKSLSRTISPDSLLPPNATKAHLTVTDSRGRKLVDKGVSFGANGSFHDQFTLPELGMGYHSIKIDFNDPEKPDDHEWHLISRHSINVAEYRPNTFEVSLKSSDVLADELVTIPLSAKYYMGKPLSKALVNWNAYSYTNFQRPDGFDEFRFGDRYQSSTDFSDNDEIRLGKDGSAQIDLEIPLDPESPAPRTVSVNAEVTDVNQQTITGGTSFTVHSSEFYMGLRKPEGIHRVGDKVPFLIANIDTRGKVYEKEFAAALTVEKEVWTSVKVKGSDGKISVRNEKHYDRKLEEALKLQSEVEPETGLARAQSHFIEFEEPGDYRITLEAVDSEGRRVLTRDRFRVIGAEEPSWEWNDVVSIDVIPDRKSYRVGDTAKLLVRSPVFGQALVTTERGGVKSTKTIGITEHETVIDIPIGEGAAPNLFASVLVVRGSQDSPHKHATANYRLGYCQIDVEDPTVDLKVTLDHGGEKYYVPGQPVEVSAMISDANDKGVAGAEVTLYAVDEGILSLTDYSTPDPADVFNEPFPLSVMMGQSLSDLFPENPLERDFGNKGYVVGGGGEADGGGRDLNRIRKNFKAVAFWKPDLVTDESGKVTYRFDAPDNLTSFRLMAVVAKGNRFGSGDLPVVINKPLIIEPALPTFSNLSDQIDIAAVLHNNTGEAQELVVNVELDDHAVFIGKLGEVVPTALSKLPKEATLKTAQLKIESGQTEVLHFPVAITRTGEANWKWKVRSLTDAKLVDATETKLPLEYPLPLLKSSRDVTLKHEGISENLLANVEERLLSGRGQIDITVSNSRMVEGADALDYLLTYPYGCVEQTTSTTIPWLSTGTMRKVLPDLSVGEAEIDRAIRKGTTRLLSMQTRDGGLSYWPGGRESVLWGSAYGGLALAIAQQNGVPLPEAQLEDLWKYLSKNLRDTGKLTDAYALSQRCLAAYTLAVAGKAEPAYLDVLFNKREKLPIEGRSLLAMAMMAGNKGDINPDLPRVETLLTEKVDSAKSNVRWYRAAYLCSSQLLAWTRFKPESPRTEKLLDELLKLKKPQRGWGSTYSNAWPLMALSAHSETAASAVSQNEIVVKYGKRTEKVSFDGTLASHTFSFPFEGDHRNVALEVGMRNPGSIYSNIKVATQPELLPMQPENRGFSIKRSYQKIDQEGNRQPAENLMVGDLILVQLDVNIPTLKEHYLAIDDPLPSILESINPDFKTRETRAVKDAAVKEKKVYRLYTQHREMRKDRTLFFADYVHRSGDYRLQYLARVIAPGECIAPPAKIEAMYEPDRFGLSGTQQLSARALKLKEDKVALR